MMRMTRKPHRRFLKSGSALALCAAVATLAFTAAGPVSAQSAVPTPESWFGHQMGADRKLEPYAKMVDLYDPGLVKFALNGSFC